MGKVAIQRLSQIKDTLNPPSNVVQESNLHSNVNYTALNPTYFLPRSAMIYPNRTGMVYDNVSYNYRELNTRVLKLATLLSTKYKISKGDKIAYLCRNIPVMLDGFFGVPSLQSIIVPINTRLNEDEIKYILNHCNAKVLIYEKEYQYIINQLKDNMDIKFIIAGEPNIIDEEETLESMMKEMNEFKKWEDLPYKESKEEDILSICYTSGTTGRPKGVMMSYRSIMLASINNAMEMEFNKYTKYLWTLPLFHCSGWCFPWSVMSVSGVSVLIKKIDYQNIWSLLLDENITHYCAAPTVQIGLIHSPKASKLLNPVKAMIAGSAPTPSLINNMESLNLIPIHTYGLTETMGPCTVGYYQSEWNDLEDKDRSKLMARQGFSYLLMDPVRVVDENMIDIPKDGKSIGEVVFRGNMVMKGYLNDPQSTSRAFQDGYFHTGDLAIIDPDGSINICDRSKDIIISGGENISSIELEKALAHHQAILEIAIIATPSEKWGETPKGFIVLKDQFKTKDEEELRLDILRFAKEKLAGFKVPSKIEFIKELPKTGTGKVQKYILKKKEWANHKNLIQ